jgi:hypothetical protein
VDDVYIHHIERVFLLLREKLPLVLEANRYFEEETGIHNEAGNNNLVDALSHLSTLVQEAPQLDDNEQRDQVTHLEDHLRRSMMEAFEQVVKLRLGDLAELWEEHMSVARPLIASGDVRGVAGIDELDRLRRRMKTQLDDGRATKRETTWEAWQRGTDHLVEACRLSDELRDSLEEGVAAAKAKRNEREAAATARWGLRLGWAGIGATVVTTIMGIIGGYLLAGGKF